MHLIHLSAAKIEREWPGYAFPRRLSSPEQVDFLDSRKPPSDPGLLAFFSVKHLIAFIRYQTKGCFFYLKKIPPGESKPIPDPPPRFWATFERRLAVFVTDLYVWTSAVVRAGVIVWIICSGS